MAKIDGVQEVAVKDLVPYEKNAKIHGEEQVELISKSIKEFGFLNPVLIDKDKNIIAGHGRVMAAKKLKMKNIPCIYVEGLTEEQQRAYILADNKLTELGEWDMDLVVEELEFLNDINFDISLTGFELDDLDDDMEEMEKEFKERMASGELSEDSEEYQEFLQKFEAKKTTDDCYTPDNIYKIIKDWAVKEYNLKRRKIIRPFYPGGDYQKENYPNKCVVIDNPPFSILSNIVKWYQEHHIDYFLFGPQLTLFSAKNNSNYILCNATITYENGAEVATGFITNLGEYKLVCDGNLRKLIDEANKENKKTKQFDKYNYPDEVFTASMGGYLARYDQSFKIKSEEVCYIRKLDAQEESKKEIYGGGFLLSENACKVIEAAREKAAREKAAREKNGIKWQLSAREKEIIKKLQ